MHCGNVCRYSTSTRCVRYDYRKEWNIATRIIGSTNEAHALQYEYNSNLICQRWIAESAVSNLLSIGLLPNGNAHSGLQCPQVFDHPYCEGPC
mmetsp:Transcript_17488/g.48533  ORF Transcript_17488/g.48533 Transcript_17488/m.48533 type:complete len:93 (-) Transcript_17488:2209-2487(-)